MGLDAKQVAQLALSQRLITPAQLEECQNELGTQANDAEHLLGLLERKSYLSAFQTEKLRKGDAQGYYLGNYRLLYKIASGSFGRVYRAEDPGSGRVVAIKLLRQRWCDKPEVIELFEREGRVGMSLRHPNIVEIITVGKDPANRQYYIVMEFVEGGNLRDILKLRGTFPVAETLKILEEVTAALVYAFGKGVTHRDMKLTNILIASQGAAKVVDFGLAQLYSSALIGEDDTQVQRTVDYAGLEKATNAPFGDVRSDIYFIGCVAYEMLSARPPLTLTKNKHARMNRERFLTVKPLLPSEIKGPALAIPLVENMMALDPTARFQTPAQLLDAIKHSRAQVAALEGNAAAAAKVAPTLFIVETDERLQDAFRDKLRQLGYKVLIAGDPSRAVDRYRQQPYHGLIVDVGTTDKDGVRAFNAVMERARSLAMPCFGFVLLNTDQQEVAARLDPEFPVTVLTRPLKMGHLLKALQKKIPTAAGNGNLAAG